MIAVSVVIPFYGEPQALYRCLAAVAEQTLESEKFEVVVVNNDPTTELSLPPGLCRPNLRIVEESQPGSYAARNRGVLAARGRFLAFTDADCTPDRSWLEKGLRRLESQDPLGGQIELTVADRASLAEQYDVVFGLNQKYYVEERAFAATANLFVSRSLFAKVGPFAARLRSGGDLEWCRRASSCGHRVRYCAEAIVRHPARPHCWQIVKQTLRFQGGFYLLERDFGILLAPGVARAPIDLLYPRLHVCRLMALKKAGHRMWWRLYLLACLINALSLAERWRLRLGGTPLR